jgi:hypothetical protein
MNLIGGKKGISLFNVFSLYIIISQTCHKSEFQPVFASSDVVFISLPL